MAVNDRSGTRRRALTVLLKQYMEELDTGARSRIDERHPPLLRPRKKSDGVRSATTT